MASSSDDDCFYDDEPYVSDSCPPYSWSLPTAVVPVAPDVAPARANPVSFEPPPCLAFGRRFTFLKGLMIGVDAPRAW
jgi:hypothetical protein